MSFTTLIPRTKKIILLQITIFCFIGLILLSIFKTYNITRPFQKQIYSQQDIDQPNTDTNRQKLNNNNNIREYPYTIVTGSSANHLCSLENFLYSLYELKPEIDSKDFPRIVVYNIGMNRTQLPVLDQLAKNGLIDQVHTFEHEKYPRFWDVAINAGQYGWKAGIINDARINYGGILIWLDAGNQVTKDFILNIHKTVVDEPFYGFWSPKSAYGMGKWTHPGMFKYFNADIKEYRYKSNCNGAAIGFDTNNNTIINTMILPWFECALNKNCIAPPGSSRENHRQDQAALTYFAYLNGHECKIAPRDFYKLQTHRDIACKQSLISLDLLNKLYHPSAIDSPKWERVDTVALYNNPEWKYAEHDVPVNIRRPMTPLDK